jgi:hypothetical protein
MSTSVQLSSQPIHWTRSEKFCCWAMNQPVLYRTLLSTFLLVPSFYYAHKLQTNLAELSLGKKLFAASSLSLLNISLAYAPLFYLQNRISSKLADKQNKFSQSIRAVHDALHQASTPLYSESEIEAIATDVHSKKATWENRIYLENTFQYYRISPQS